MIYLYRIVRGKATLTKVKDGTDIDQKPKQIGAFSSDAQAKAACIEHHRKAMLLAERAGRIKPEIRFC